MSSVFSTLQMANSRWLTPEVLQVGAHMGVFAPVSCSFSETSRMRSLSSTKIATANDVLTDVVFEMSKQRSGPARCPDTYLATMMISTKQVLLCLTRELTYKIL